MLDLRPELVLDVPAEALHSEFLVAQQPVAFARGVVDGGALVAEQLDRVELGVVVMHGERDGLLGSLFDTDVRRARRHALRHVRVGGILQHGDAVVPRVLVVADGVDVVADLVEGRADGLGAGDERLLVAAAGPVLRHQREEVVWPVEVVVRGGHERGAVAGFRDEELAGLG